MRCATADHKLEKAGREESPLKTGPPAVASPAGGDKVAKIAQEVEHCRDKREVKWQPLARPTLLEFH